MVTVQIGLGFRLRLLVEFSPAKSAWLKITSPVRQKNLIFSHATVLYVPAQSSQLSCGHGPKRNF